MRLPKALLIDLDDTLICFDGVSRESWEEACATGCAVSDHTETSTGTLVDAIWDYAHWYYSDSRRHREGRNDLEETRRMIVREAFKKLGLEDDGAAGEIADRYSVIRDEKLFLFPGVRETLKTIRDKGMKLCLVTNGEAHLQRRKIERFDLAPCFDAIFIEGECGYGKPDERIFTDALEAAAVRAEDAWIVGDNLTWEVVAPKQLGFTCIWRDKKGEGLPAWLPAGSPNAPDAIIDEFPEILDLLEKAEAP